ncbi:MAG: Alpha-hemolysin translocation ATP-binding protein HlyB [Candidatus Anoxychlamydiales bacterium]|nr:Alpha-hemolysin translocation ATP-binding protein HlyB [Candidatus Anoxychlamydiales bacterium]
MKFINKLFFRKRVKTPTIIQMEIVECGAVALGIILAYFKKFISLENLRELCSITRDGSNAYQIIDGATKLGLKADGYKREINELNFLKFPCIIYWKFNHFVVLEGYYRNGFYINDPASGPRKVSIEEFDESYTGITIEFEKTDKFKKTGRPFSLFESVFNRFKNVKKSLTYSIIATFLLVFPGLIIPVLIQIFYDQIIQINYNRVFFFSIFFLTIIFSISMNFLQGYIFAKLNAKSSISWSGKLFKHVLRLPIKFYLMRYAGEIANRLYLNDFITYMLTTQLAVSIVNLFFVIFYLLVIIQLSFEIAIVALISVALNFFLLKYINRSRSDDFARFQMDFGKILGITVGGIANIETLKASGGESVFFARWSGYFTKTLIGVQSINLKDIFLTSFPQIFQIITISFFLLIGTLKVLDGTISIGMMLAIQMLLLNFLIPFIRFINLGQMLQESKSDINRIDDVLNQKKDQVFEFKNTDTTKNKSYLEGFIEVKNLSFGFDKNKEPYIENLSFSLTPGQSIAFVGLIGSGKTTILNLLKGIYAPWSGEILYDNIPFCNINSDLFLRSLSSVDQNSFLFEGTYNDNITLWDHTISENNIFKAAKDAAIHDEIISQNLNYNATIYEEGRNLSGGQKQRVEIARALVKNPRIILLDEATSSVDSQTENNILKSIKRRGCTLIMVAHRLSTIKDADEIIVLEKGKVIQRGNHETLKHKEGLYQKLVKDQGLK